MGNNCGAPPPDTRNVCSTALGQTHRIPNFCTLAGSHRSTREDYCGRLSNGEWEYGQATGGCQYNTCDEVTAFSSVGCCRGCCAIVGLGVECRRRSFKGDPLLCCLRDQSCNSAPETCFDDTTQRQTCSPETRDQSSNPCRTRLLQYCTGVTATGEAESSQEWVQRWLGPVTLRGPDGAAQTYQQPCLNAVYRNLYASAPQSIRCGGRPQPTIVPSGTGYIYAQQLVSAMIARYLRDGGRLDATEDSEGNTQLNSLIQDLCRNTPGLCARALSQACSTVTVETLQRSPTLIPWCGCHMPPEQYSRYTDLYQLARECTPTCNLSGVIPLVGADGITTLTCRQSACIIDQVAINITRSIVGGNGISFGQLCSSCQSAVSGGGTGSCTCIITGATYNIINAQTGNIAITQECGAKGLCYQELKQPDGTTRSVRVDCNSDGETNPYAEAERLIRAAQDQAIVRRNLWIVLIVTAVVVVLLLLRWFLRRSKS